ncbi:hypothetical protein K1T71_011100 [Dendrolimus kikuchii]|uniref:Uncharacterized protein n=1 Tax=Dendrolimus kikuchii TaxID=765133 RepID=A0ACC1CMS7_9NEOP|nr:hypothetical protein K1T71_011100 [Dendrolimus kikuchii]
MSDSSSEEDLSRFKDVVDTSFTKEFTENKAAIVKKSINQKSERYLHEATHYNDVKVPEEMQKHIGAKLSAIIKKKYEFTEVQKNDPESQTDNILGGVKLFKDSNGFLSCHDVIDISTEMHNHKSKKHKRRRKQIEDNGLSEQEKINYAVVSGDHILSKEDTKRWNSRRKEKVFKYKSNKGSKVLISVE